MSMATQFHRLTRAIQEDLNTIMERDPSISTLTEALFHPTLPAIWGYRIAARLHSRRLRLTARVLSNAARFVTGVEIHPGARIGRRFFIDHGAGVVIGETAVIGDDVTIYHQVTLGAVGWWKDRLRDPGEPRHPFLGDRVVVGANATLIGPIHVGHDSVIGAHALVVKDVPPGTRVFGTAAQPDDRPLRIRSINGHVPYDIPHSALTDQRNSSVSKESG